MKAPQRSPQDDWSEEIILPLQNQYSFPPLCVYCGGVQEETIDHEAYGSKDLSRRRVSTKMERVVSRSHNVRLSIPYCSKCASLNRRIKRRFDYLLAGGMVFGGAVGAGSFIILMFAVDLGEMGDVIGIASLVGGLLIGAAAAVVVGKLSSFLPPQYATTLGMRAIIDSDVTRMSFQFTNAPVAEKFERLNLRGRE